jgi:hypothetical protein
MIHRGIATLATALMLCFLLLSHFDSQFFLVHFYESLMYVAIVLMLFYFEDRWAYMLGILAPGSWLVLITSIGGLPSFLRQVLLVIRLERPEFPAHLLGAVAFLLAITMIIFCVLQWRRQFAGTGKVWTTFLPCLGVVTVYYAVMVLWILRWPTTVA